MASTIIYNRGKYIGLCIYMAKLIMMAIKNVGDESIKRWIHNEINNFITNDITHSEPALIEGKLQ